MFWLQMNTVHCETCQYEARLSIDNIIIISIFLGDCHRVSIGWQIQLQEGKFAQRLLSAAVLQAWDNTDIGHGADCQLSQSTGFDGNRISVKSVK